MIYVDAEKCDGCGLCIEACPHHALKPVNGVVEVDQALCRQARACVAACPQQALLELVEPGEGRDHLVPVAEAPLVEGRQAAIAKRNLGLTAFLGAGLQFLLRDVAPELWRQWSRRQVSGPTSSPQLPSARGQCRGGEKQHRRRRKRWRA